MNTTFERRVVVADLTLRAAPKGSKSPGRLAGYAAKFNVYSQDLGGFREKIRPGAFKRSLAEGADIRALFNHDPSQVLGRTKSGTLSVSEDSVGLRFVVDLPNTQLGRDLHESISRGDVTQCSFAFKVPMGGESWGKDQDENGQQFVTREVSDADLFDVSAVTYPAYLDTNVSALTPSNLNVSSIRVSEGALLEARSRGGHARRIFVPHVETVQELRDRQEMWGRIIKLDAELAQKRKADRRAENIRRNHGRHPMPPC